MECPKDKGRRRSSLTAEMKDERMKKGRSGPSVNPGNDTFIYNPISLVDRALSTCMKITAMMMINHHHLRDWGTCDISFLDSFISHPDTKEEEGRNWRKTVLS